MVTIKEHNKRYLEAMDFILESRGLTIQMYADSLGINRTLLSHIRNGKQNASIDLLSNTVFSYPEINADYIITGRGSMFIGEHQENVSYDSELEEVIVKLQEELSEAYAEIGRLNMKLKSVKEHNSKIKIG